MKKGGHANRAHALLSASAAHRWLKCTPSARLEEKLPEQTSSYADEGRLAHELAELILRRFLGELTPGKFDKALKKFESDPRYSAEMLSHVQDYADIVIERIGEADKRCGDAVVLIEQQLDYSRWVPEGFGTGDVVIISDDVLEIVDLKYGQGVPVSALGNAQMRLYALGAIDTFGPLYDFTQVRMTIVQPRLDNVSSDVVDIADLLKWAEEEVAPRARLAFDGKGEFVPGDHCRFCRARYTCRARAEFNLELAKYDFAPPELLTDEEVGEILARAEELQKWVADLQEWALQQALQGEKIPGWKLVEGRSTRRITDEAAATQALIAAGFDPDEITPRQLLGISKLERLVGKKRFEELLGPYVDKPPGKPVLVPESDKRPELTGVEAARRDFQD